MPTDRFSERSFAEPDPCWPLAALVAALAGDVVGLTEVCPSARSAEGCATTSREAYVARGFEGAGLARCFRKPL